MSVSERRLTRDSRALPRQRPTGGTQQRTRVYVSSTYQDLVEHRREIRLALQRMGLDDVAMETYAAGEERPLDKCLADVRSVDIYVGILAWRAGFVPPGQARSITELEYEQAGSAGIPRLMFLLDPDAPWPYSAGDWDRTRISVFRDRVSAEVTCDTFTSVEHLRAAVAEAVARHLREAGGFAAEDEWQEYRTRLVQVYQRLDLEALTPPDREEHLQIALRDVFVEPDVREDVPDTELPKALQRKLEEAAELGSTDLPRGLDRQLVEQAREAYGKKATQSAFAALTAPLSRASVLLGDPGAGKSTLARYLTVALAEGRTNAVPAALRGWQPVLIELREYAQHCDRFETFPAYLDHRLRTEQFGLHQDFLDRYLRDDGRVLVIFDGLDEVFDPRLRQTVARRIAGFAAQYPSARVLVTSRMVGYRPRILRDAGFAHYTVQDLGQDKIDRFLRSWYGLALHDRPTAADHLRQRLGRAIRESAPIRELAGNPLLLTILAIIGKHQELPRERWKVYNHAADVLVQHWDVNKHLDDERINADVIREDDKKELLGKLAVRMQEGTHGFAGNSVTEADLFRDIEAYLAERFQYGPVRAAEVAAAMVRQLRERNFIFARYGPRIYGFVHRALLEFFAARELVSRFEKTRVLSEQELGGEVFVRRSEDPAWSEVLRLIAGMVDATVASRLIHRLLDSPGTHRSSALNRQPLALVALAAQCVAEIRNTNAAAGAAERTLRALIDLLGIPARSFGDDNRGAHLEKTVLPAFAAVSAWPGRARFRDWFMSTGQFTVAAPASELGAQLLAALFPGDETIHALLHRLIHSTIGDQREAALTALAATWQEHPDTVQTIADGVYDPAAFVRRAALDLLITKWPADERTLGRLSYAVADPDPDLRREAVEALARHATTAPGTRAAVVRALRHDSVASVRIAAIRALASTWPEHEETKNLLVGAGTDPAWDVRQAALTTVVARFGADPGVFTALLAATRDDDEDVRETAVGLLVSRWSDAAESRTAALTAMRDPHYKVRRGALKAIAQRWPGDPASAAALDRAKADPDGDVRVTALTARTDPVTALEEYVAILEGVIAGDPLGDARRAALEALVSEAVELSGTSVERALRDPDANVRAAALAALSGSLPGISDLYPTVLRLCADADDDVRLGAVRAAATFWGHRPEVTTVLVHASRAASWELRRTALESLAALLPDDPRTRHALRQGTRDRAASIRYASLRLRIALHDPDSGYLDRAAVDPDRWIREDATALRQLSAQRGGAAPDLRSPAAERLTGADREAALRATALTRTDDATGAAERAATEDPDPAVRLAGYEIVCSFRHRLPGGVALMARASRDRDEDVRRFGLAALLAAWPDHPGTANAVRRGLQDLAAAVRRLALEALILRSPNGPATERAVDDAMSDSDWGVRRLALDTVTLRHAGTSGAATGVRARLHHPDNGVRDAAMQALRAGWEQDEATFDAIAGRLGEPQQGSRIAALRCLALGWPDDPRTGPIVATARRSLSADVARAAWDIQEQREQGRPRAGDGDAASYRSPDPVHRMLALDDMIRRGGTERELAVACRVHLPDGTPAVQARVQHALTNCLDDETVRTLLAGAGDHPWVQVRRTDLRVRRARWPGARETDEAIRTALRDASPGLRKTALYLLAETAGNTAEAHVAVTLALSDPDWAVRQAAVELTAMHWPDDPATVGVLSRSCHDYSAGVRRAALDTITIGWPDRPETTRAIQDAASDVNVRQRAAAEGARARLGPPTGPRSGPGLPDERTAALRQVIHAADEAPDDPASLAAVLRLAAHPDWWIRVVAVSELANRWRQHPETLQVLRGAIADSREAVRMSAVKLFAEVLAGLEPARAALHSLALQDSSPAVRGTALPLLRTRTDADTKRTMAISAREADLAVVEEAVLALVTGWPDDEAARDAANLALRSSAVGMWDVAHDWMRADTRPLPRDSLLASAQVPDLVALATCWGDDPEVTSFLRDRLGGDDDIARAVCLDGLLGWAGGDPEVTAALPAAATDGCPAVRAMALQELIRRGDRTATAAAATDPDPWIRITTLLDRAVHDRSGSWAAEAVALARTMNSAASYHLTAVVCVWAGADLIDPRLLASAEPGLRLSAADHDWLSWLIEIRPIPEARPFTARG